MRHEEIDILIRVKRDPLVDRSIGARFGMKVPIRERVRDEPPSFTWGERPIGRRSRVGRRMKAGPMEFLTPIRLPARVPA